MTDAVSEFAPKRRPVQAQGGLDTLGAMEAEIVAHQRATEESTRGVVEAAYQKAADESTRDSRWQMRPGGVVEKPAQRDALTDIALMVAALPLRVAMEQAEAVVTLPDYKPPTTKIELAMQLNEWAEKRLAGVYGEPNGGKP